MNLPQYVAAIETAVREYENACGEARERMLKAIASAKESFFDEPPSKAIYAEENVVARR